MPVESSQSESAPNAGEPTFSIWEKLKLTVAGIIPYARRHKRSFIIGALAAIGIVVTRLALPWPLRSISNLLGSSDPSATQVDSIFTQVLTLSSLFLLTIVVLGFCDFAARLFLSRFSIATTRDLRQAAFVTSMGIDATSRKAATGDLVSRLIGDSARVKAGMQGFLLHVVTNGLLFIGVTAILFSVNAKIGILFTVAAALIAVITVIAARRVFEISLRIKKGNWRTRFIPVCVKHTVIRRLSGLTNRAVITKLPSQNCKVKQRGQHT